jgi:S1-C subfamily serine protease
MTRKQIVSIVLLAFVVGAAGSVFFERVVFPNLATVPGFSWVRKLQSASPIVITRREEVRLNEGVNLIELSKQAQTIVVSIYSPSPNPRYLGNGIIITSDGVIFTVDTVVASFNEVTIMTNEGNIYKGAVRAQDPKSPIAVVTVPGRDMPVAQFSDAANMQTAQRVFSLGFTDMEFNREFASGLITKTLFNNLAQQEIMSADVFKETIRTDAQLGPSFIGSPVVNLQGTVIGMVIGGNGEILTSEAIDGAIKSYLPLGKIMRPFYGMDYRLISNNLAKVLNLPKAGAQVVNVLANNAAAKSGLLVNDVILEVNGKKVTDSSLEQLFIEGNSNPLRLLIQRGTEQRELTLTPDLR